MSNVIFIYSHPVHGIKAYSFDEAIQNHKLLEDDYTHMSTIKELSKG